MGTVAIAGLALMACGQAGLDTATRNTAPSPVTTPTTPDIADAKKAEGGNTSLKASNDFPELSDFTTEGKPTKTIETPWGPREIYDPVQDPQVIANFKLIHQLSERPIREDYLLALDEKDILYKAVEVVLAARHNFRRKLMDESLVDGQNICQVFKESSCRTYENLCFTDGTCKLVTEVKFGFTVIPRHQSNENHPVYDLLPATTQQNIKICETNYSESTVSTDYKIIGDLSPESFEDQLNWFFAYSCQSKPKK